LNGCSVNVVGGIRVPYPSILTPVASALQSIFEVNAGIVTRSGDCITVLRVIKVLNTIPDALNVRILFPEAKINPISL